MALLFSEIRKPNWQNISGLDIQNTNNFLDPLYVLKQRKHELNHSPPGVEVNAWSFIATSPYTGLSYGMVLTHRHNLTFLPLL
jgi:hypothetical protein